MTPKVSVVLATYNRAYILEVAVRSVLAQTYKDFELIIVDDGSTDNTKELVDSFADDRIRYIKHETNKGLAVSRNTGIRAAVGEYVAYQDSDDEWMPEKLAKHVQLLDKAPKKVGVVYGVLEKILKDKTKVFLPPEELKKKGGDLHLDLMSGNFITMQVVLMRRECFEKSGLFDENLNWLEDWDFWLRVSKHYEFIHVPEIAVRATIMGDSLTSNRAKRLDARRKTFDKHIEEFLKHPAIYQDLSYRIGHAYGILGNMTDAQKYLKEAKSGAIKYALAYLLSFLGAKIYHFVARAEGKVSQAYFS